MKDQVRPRITYYIVFTGGWVFLNTAPKHKEQDNYTLFNMLRVRITGTGITVWSRPRHYVTFYMRDLFMHDAKDISQSTAIQCGIGTSLIVPHHYELTQP